MDASPVRGGTSPPLRRARIALLAGTSLISLYLWSIPRADGHDPGEIGGMLMVGAGLGAIMALVGAGMLTFSVLHPEAGLAPTTRAAATLRLSSFPGAVVLATVLALGPPWAAGIAGIAGLLVSAGLYARHRRMKKDEPPEDQAPDAEDEDPL